MPTPRGQFGEMLSRAGFRQRFQGSFGYSAFERVREALAQVEEVAWDAYINEKKPARTQKEGAEFADLDYDLSVKWKEARDKLLAAEVKQKDRATPSRILLIVEADRNDGTHPGEMSKTFRLMQIAKQVLEEKAFDVDVLDLSRLISDYDWHIHPCKKGCVRSMTGWARCTKSGSPRMASSFLRRCTGTSRPVR